MQNQSVDMVIFLNGVPIISLELKNHFTGQNVQHAITQYRRRDPREPFFPRCLVHFALDDDAAYHIAFEEADRVVNAIKDKLESDEALRAAFNTNSVEFLRRQKLQDSIKDAFLSNADEFLNFMSKTETDPGFGKFFFAEMFKWYSTLVAPKQPPAKGV